VCAVSSDPLGRVYARKCPQLLTVCAVTLLPCRIVSECLAHKRPLVFVRRDFFNEEPFLRKKLEVRAENGHPMQKCSVLAVCW
jgi:hypothetical protein